MKQGQFDSRPLAVVLCRERDGKRGRRRQGRRSGRRRRVVAAGRRGRKRRRRRIRRCARRRRRQVRPAAAPAARLLGCAAIVLGCAAAVGVAPAVARVQRARVVDAVRVVPVRARRAVAHVAVISGDVVETRRRVRRRRRRWRRRRRRRCGAGHVYEQGQRHRGRATPRHRRVARPAARAVAAVWQRFLGWASPGRSHSR